MGWEQRGNNSYYYRKEREGARVKSVYVGRGEIAQMVAQLQSSSPLIERFARTMKSPQQVQQEKVEAALEQASDLIEIDNRSVTSCGWFSHSQETMEAQTQWPLMMKKSSLTLVELSYSNTMKQSITLTLGMYWEKRLSGRAKTLHACL